MKGYDKTKRREYSKIRKELLTLPSKSKDSNFIRIHYVRYADDFIIGIEGSYNLAKEILKKVELFVNNKLGLKFNHDKTDIIDFEKDSVNFLGFNIRGPFHKRALKPIETIRSNGRIISRRTKGRLVIEMDTAKVLKKLLNSGFVKKVVSHRDHKDLEYKGTFKGNLINLDHADIIRYYNSVIRGLQNYYSFCRNRISIARVG